ncbi:MAG: hypothetical protein A2Y33_15435 [Spirochaetes bacterium GWF1_51_8]|nr:MAG: hypothetical protein A2Y33_15435 [Spirochaetes bacterium GWF1_51_8]
MTIWMIALAVFVVFTLVIFIAAYHEANRVRITRSEIVNRKAVGEIDILQISDLHLYRSVNKKRLAAIKDNIDKTIAEKTPDLIFLTGDFLDHENGARHLRDILARLKATHGIYAVFGNHDYYVYNILHVMKPLFSWTDNRPADIVGLKQILHDYGIKTLVDEKVTVEAAGRRLDIYGADYYTVKKKRPGSLDIRQSENLSILLSHYPDAVLYYRNLADIVISGHTHGGQFSFFGVPVITSSRIKFMRAKGLTKYGDTSLFISMGIGSSRFFPFRFFADPEINRITIKGE